MKLVTTEQIGEIDRRAIEEYGIPGLVLMENAGLCVMGVLESEFGNPASKKFAIIAGKGNNGGDGLVVARHLANNGAEVDIFLIARESEIKGDAAVNLKIVRKIGLPLHQVTEEEDLNFFSSRLEKFDILIDALFGTGITGKIQGLPARIIEMMNQCHKPIVAVDLPSGLDADTGQAEGPVVKATITVTMGLPKVGLVVYPGARFAGKLVVGDIGLPGSLLTDESLSVSLLTMEEVKLLLPERDPAGHKGTFGHVLVLAGSVGYTGAPALTALGALRVGAGLVTLAVPRSIYSILASRLTEVMIHPLPETGELTLGKNSWEGIKNLMEKVQVIAVGPGLSRHPEIEELMHHLLEETTLPMVIDADAINALTSYPQLLSRSQAPLVITPHPGEMSRLMKKPVEIIQANRLAYARELAQLYQVVVVLKGARTVVADKEGRVRVNLTGNAGMASAGMGDVLTGAIAGLMAQGKDAFSAACLGVFIHGLAGDLVAESQGEIGLMAGDVLETLPEALRQMAKEDRGK